MSGRANFVYFMWQGNSFANDTFHTPISCSYNKEKGRPRLGHEEIAFLPCSRTASFYRTFNTISILFS